MKRKTLLFFIAIFLAGCASPSLLGRSRVYRDPLTYSFEGQSPPSEEDPILQIITQMKGSLRHIREWEEKHLW